MEHSELDTWWRSAARHDTEDDVREDLGRARRPRGAGPAVAPLYRPALDPRGHVAPGVRRPAARQAPGAASGVDVRHDGPQRAHHGPLAAHRGRDLRPPDGYADPQL